MNLLLTNDDGIASPGMAALIRELAGDHTLYVSAPDRQRSAAGASMTIRRVGSSSFPQTPLRERRSPCAKNAASTSGCRPRWGSGAANTTFVFCRAIWCLKARR